MHPFDRYKAFTDLVKLLESSAIPLRKSLRVNTLKTSIAEVEKWGTERGWRLSPVPWCREGFFVERSKEPLDSPLRGSLEESIVLGKDLLHQLGSIYVQEAASMLPVELLDPQPNEEILDLCAAPGSKTTQIAAKMQNSGVIIANDVQEKRLWTLHAACQRSGITNTILTSKNGEWFGAHMTERFDRVLCDAPCSAQGIARKDPSALKLCTDKNIEKLKSMQMKLLESAIHAAKVGGRIVYSTCTLTPEENEEVVMEIMEKFSGKIAIVGHEKWKEDSARLPDRQGKRIVNLEKAMNDSIIVQDSINNHFPLSSFHYPLLRLWPQTYDTEGFFCAVLVKKDHTRDVRGEESVQLRGELTPSRTKDIASELIKRYGTSFMEERERLYETGQYVTLINEAASRFILPCPRYAFGLPMLKLQKDSRIRLTHEMITLRGKNATIGTLELVDQQKETIFEGKDAACDSALSGELILRWRGIPLGLGLAKEGMLKNWIPRVILKQIS